MLEATTICRPTPWKWCPSHVWRGLPLCQFVVFLGLSLLDLGPMYATDRCQADRQTYVRRTSSLNAPRPYGLGHNKFEPCLLQLIMFWLIYITMNIQNVPWLECRNGDVWATVSAIVNNAVCHCQQTHQSDASSNHSHPALLSRRVVATNFVINWTEVTAVR